MKKKTWTYYAFIISAMLIFGTIGIFRRFIPYSSGFLAFTRGILGALFLCLCVKLQRKKIFHPIGWKKFLLFVLVGGLIGANWILLFESYNHTTVSVATLCYYMQPTIVILVSPFLFREKFTLKKIICVLVSLTGMVFVSGILDGEKLQSLDFTGVLLGLGAAVLYASVIILNKKVQTEDIYEKTIIELFSASLCILPYVLLTGGFVLPEFSMKILGTLLLVGILHTGIAYALYFESMNHLKAQSVAVLSYIDPVSALVLSALILKEQMTFFGILGAVLIIGAALVSEIEFPMKKKDSSSGKEVQ